MSLILFWTGTVPTPTVRRRYVDDPLYAVAIGQRLPMNPVVGEVNNLSSTGAKDTDFITVRDGGVMKLAIWDDSAGVWKHIRLDTTEIDETYLKLDASNDPVTDTLTLNKGVVINESGDDNDTRIEGNTEENLFYIDAGEDEVRMGDGDTNYTAFESDGTMKMVGDATVWDDIRVPLSSIKRLGFTDPDWVQLQDDGAGSTGVYALAFDKTTDEEVFFSVQIPHGWKLGSNLNPHVHWSPSDTDTGSVTWKLEYTLSDINGTFGNTSTLSVTDAGDGTAKKHQYADLGDIDMSSYTDGGDVSIILVCRLYRDVSDGDDYDNDALLLEIDFHYEIDTIGSRSETSK